MTEIEQAETQAVFNLAARVAKYVRSIEMSMLEEADLSEELREQIAAENLLRQEYSPFFKVMTKADAKAYNHLCAEITAASQLEIIGGNFSEKTSLTDTFMQRVSSPAIRMQEFLISVAIRENLMDEDELISFWPQETSEERDVPLLEKYEAPVLAHIAREAQPHIF